jgi:hypothetical protein
MSKRMARFLANPPKRLLPETVASRRTKMVRRGRPRGWLEELCEAQNWRCHYCKRSMSRKPNGKRVGGHATLDHLLPISRGGRNQWGNLAAACFSCNTAKGSMTEAEFRAAQGMARDSAETQSGSGPSGLPSPVPGGNAP